jgi:hypothetical protein
VALPLYMNDGAQPAPDSRINPTFHRGLAYGAAGRLLDEGTDAEAALAEKFGADFYKWITRALAQSYQDLTNGDFSG